MRYFKVWFYYIHDMNGEMYSLILNEVDTERTINNAGDFGIEIVTIEDYIEE